MAKNEYTDDFFFYLFTFQHNRSAELGDEIEHLNVRYRLTAEGWVDVVKSSRDEKPKNTIYQGEYTKQCNMEKQIKMSLETARTTYKVLMQSDKLTMAETVLSTLLLENFTKEELEGKKGFTWEESFNGNGHYLSLGSRITSARNYLIKEDNKAVFKTKEQAESALAFAQLTHIVAKYNKTAKSGHGWIYISPSIYNEGELTVINANHKHISSHLYFLNQEDALTSIEVNRELWLKYWMIK